MHRVEACPLCGSPDLVGDKRWRGCGGCGRTWGPLADAPAFRPVDELDQPLTVGDLLASLGVAGARLEEQRAAVLAWLKRHEPSPLMRAGLERLELTPRAVALYAGVADPYHVKRDEAAELADALEEYAANPNIDADAATIARRVAFDLRAGLAGTLGHVDVAPDELRAIHYVITRSMYDRRWNALGE